MGKELKTRGKGERNRVGTLKSRLGHQAGIPAREGQETGGVLGAWDSDFKRVPLKLWALGWDRLWAGQGPLVMHLLTPQPPQVGTL